MQANVIEARMDKGMGPVATVIVEHGTLAVGAIVAVGTEWGKVRSQTQACSGPVLVRDHPDLNRAAAL